MFKTQKAYLLKDRGLVVLNKSDVNDTTDGDYKEVTIAFRMSDIKEWAEEIEMLGLDEDEEF